MYEYLPFLKENYYVAFQVGDRTNPRTIIRQVIKKEIIPLTYDILDENGLPPTLSPVGVTSTTQTSAPFYVDFNQLQLNSIANIQDLFNIPNSSDVYQVFAGVAPSYIRFVWKQPPVAKSLGTLSQSTIFDQATYYEIGFDGFMSPFEQPSADTEMFAIPGVSLSLYIINTVSVPVVPTFKFIINRMSTVPVTDQNTINGIMSGKIPAKFVSISGVNMAVSGAFEVGGKQ